MEQETKESVKTANQILEDKMLKYKKKKNIEAYKSYRTLSYDVIFYYATIYLFLTMVKGFSPAQVIEFDAFYFLFRFLVQIPSTILIQRIGKRNSIIIASFLNAINILIIMFLTNYPILVISQILSATGFTIKATCETDMLYDSLERDEKRGSNFAKIDGKAMSRHYYLEAFSSLVSGFLFVYNSYLPMLLCFITLLVSAFISLRFEDVEKKRKPITIMEDYKNIKYAFKDIFKSRRLISLLIFNALMVTMIKLFQSLRNTVLVDIQMPTQYFGVIFAALELISGIASKNQDKIHKHYRNRTLTFLGFPTAISCLFIGIVLLMNLKNEVATPIILVLFAIQYVMRGPYFVLIKRYFNNFTNSQKRVKIATVNNFIESLISALLMFASAYILDSLPIDYTMLIIGGVEVILVVVLLDAMRKTVGLKMEEYDQKEIL